MQKRAHTSVRAVWLLKSFPALSIFIFIFRDVGSITSTSSVFRGSSLYTASLQEAAGSSAGSADLMKQAFSSLTTAAL